MSDHYDILDLVKYKSKVIDELKSRGTVSIAGTEHTIAQNCFLNKQTIEECANIIIDRRNSNGRA